MAHNFVSTLVVDAHVRLCTLRLPTRVLSRSASKCRRQRISVCVSDLLCQSPFRNAVTYDLVRSLLRKGLFRASHPNAAVSEQGAFCILMRASANEYLFGDGLTKTPSECCLTRCALIRSVLDYDVSLSETESRAAQPSVHRRCNRRLNAAAR